ncbi:MAG: hypothetical protein ABSB74_20455 [Tepidisphaeraceae bacterium]
MSIALLTRCLSLCMYRAVVTRLAWCIDLAMSFSGTPASARAVPWPWRIE